MIFLLLAIISSAMISVIMRISTEKNEGKYAPLAMNYLICTLLSAGYAGFGRLFPAHAGLGLTLGLGAISGVLFLAAFLLLQINVQKNGVVFSAVFMKLGLLVPMALSILFFGEIPTWLQGVGFLAAVGAILLMHLQKGAGNARAAGGLILLLLAGGGSDAMAKVFETLGPGELANQFLFYNFSGGIFALPGPGYMEEGKNRQAGNALWGAAWYPQFLFDEISADGAGRFAGGDCLSYLQCGHHPGGDGCRPAAF